MNQACQLCRGACCESLLLSTPTPYLLDWAVTRGVQVSPTTVELPCRCRHLTEGGLCGIHLRRPQACYDYAVGGPECRAAVKRRRTAEEAKKILAAMKSPKTKG